MSFTADGARPSAVMLLAALLHSVPRERRGSQWVGLVNGVLALAAPQQDSNGGGGGGAAAGAQPPQSVALRRAAVAALGLLAAAAAQPSAR